VNLPAAARDNPTKVTFGRAMPSLPEMMDLEQVALFP
jgi:hypothetical protein